MQRANTKSLIWFGRNSANQSHLSSKVYMLAVRGKRLYTRWGAADLIGRKVQPVYLQSKSQTYWSHGAAVEAFEAILEAKLRNGYELAPRGMSNGLTAL